MRSTPIGIVLMDDERPSAYEPSKEMNMAVTRGWAEIIRRELRNLDGTCPEVVVGSDTITNIRIAQRVGDELRRAGCRQVVVCYNVWNFPFLIWPFINSLERDVPILSLSNNNGKYPGNVGLLATDSSLRQAGIRTHRIVGEMDDPATVKKVIDWL